MKNNNDDHDPFDVSPYQVWTWRDTCMLVVLTVLVLIGMALLWAQMRSGPR